MGRFEEAEVRRRDRGSVAIKLRVSFREGPAIWAWGGLAGPFSCER